MAHHYHASTGHWTGASPQASRAVPTVSSMHIDSCRNNDPPTCPLDARARRLGRECLYFWARHTTYVDRGLIGDRYQASLTRWGRVTLLLRDSRERTMRAIVGSKAWCATEFQITLRAPEGRRIQRATVMDARCIIGKSEGHIIVKSDGERFRGPCTTADGRIEWARFNPANCHRP